MGLGPSLLGQTIRPTDEDGLARGRGGRGQEGTIGFFGWWSLHVHFGTHNGVPVLYSGALKNKENEGSNKLWFYGLKGNTCTFITVCDSCSECCLCVDTVTELMGSLLSFRVSTQRQF